MTTRDQEEHDLRIDRMTVNIEKMRVDMRTETKRFAWQAIAFFGAAAGGGGAILALILHLSGRI